MKISYTIKSVEDRVPRVGSKVRITGRNGTHNFLVGTEGIVQDCSGFERFAAIKAYDIEALVNGKICTQFVYTEDFLIIQH